MTRSAVSLVVLVLLSPSTRADEKPVARGKAPEAVSGGVKKAFPKADWVGAARETEGDKVEYEVSIKAEDPTIDVMAPPDGKIPLIEKTIPAKKLPEAVADALKSKYPG